MPSSSSWGISSIEAALSHDARLLLGSTGLAMKDSEPRNPRSVSDSERVEVSVDCINRDDFGLGAEKTFVYTKSCTPFKI